jgi:hypothetical protein
VTSPQVIDSTKIPPLTCSAIAKKSCSLRVTSVYVDKHEHSAAYEGGMTILMFQQQPDVMPGG